MAAIAGPANAGPANAPFVDPDQAPEVGACRDRMHPLWSQLIKAQNVSPEGDGKDAKEPQKSEVNRLSSRSGLRLNRLPVASQFLEAAPQMTWMGHFINWDFIDQIPDRHGKKGHKWQPVCLCAPTVFTGEECISHILRDENGMHKATAKDHFAVQISPIFETDYEDKIRRRTERFYRICPYAYHWFLTTGKLESCFTRQMPVRQRPSIGSYFLKFPDVDVCLRGTTREAPTGVTVTLEQPCQKCIDKRDGGASSFFTGTFFTKLKMRPHALVIYPREDPHLDCLLYGDEWAAHHGKAGRYRPIEISELLARGIQNAHEFQTQEAQQFGD
ncbi:hypothetical protein P154DRAFT_594512 [Amniculicola lignicola CBS 123094]|uniref:Uncharacterized protein n=1 Tax=Amniculicola lignicola CBS 123094 TaxID=1392246 RepID=A0A6A5WX52_9PLEO|nr:hypothetical protein P154DRAFT_594512 [Amniculicola lignicola CBS 123094]